MPSFSFDAGALGPVLAEAADALESRQFARRLFARDPSAWTDDPEVQRKIATRLGWLTSPADMAGRIPALRRFGAEVREAGVDDVVLLGMGGSSLAPEVLRAVLGVQAGYPRFTMLDTVNAERIRQVGPHLPRTMFVLASKSGSTIEPNALAAHFRRQLEAEGLPWARHFVAITDPGTELQRVAEREGFREVFLNPPDIGGRYSAISLFGLVPAALMGLDVGALVADARSMIDRAAADQPLLRNEALALGVLMGAAAAHGRDKLTLLLPGPLDALGLWIEQLVAESTGKNGRGVVPVAGEPLGHPAHYGTDRLIVRVRLSGHDDGRERAAQGLVADLAGAAMPVAEIVLDTVEDLGAEFVRWELATATAAAVLGINPFDEPNVQQAKDATRRLLDEHAAHGRLPDPAAPGRLPGGRLSITAAARTALAGRDGAETLALLSEGDYCAVLAYLPESAELTARVAEFRDALRARTGCATTFGYGPRYLHSTGQLHKGGGNSGVFVLVTAPAPELDVPGQPFSFGVLEQAQALGDFASLDAAGRRAIHLHLDAATPAALDAALRALVPPKTA